MNFYLFGSLISAPLILSFILQGTEGQNITFFSNNKCTGTELKRVDDGANNITLREDVTLGAQFNGLWIFQFATSSSPTNTSHRVCKFTNLVLGTSPQCTDLGRWNDKDNNSKTVVSFKPICAGDQKATSLSLYTMFMEPPRNYTATATFSPYTANFYCFTGNSSWRLYSQSDYSGTDICLPSDPNVGKTGQGVTFGSFQGIQQVGSIVPGCSETTTITPPRATTPQVQTTTKRSRGSFIKPYGNSVLALFIVYIFLTFTFFQKQF